MVHASTLGRSSSRMPEAFTNASLSLGASNASNLLVELISFLTIMRMRKYLTLTAFMPNGVTCQHPVSSSQHPNKQPSETNMRSNRHHRVRDLYLPVHRTQHAVPAESIAVHAAPSTQYPAPSTKHTAPHHPAPSIWLTAPQQTAQRNSLFS